MRGGTGYLPPLGHVQPAIRRPLTERDVSGRSPGWCRYAVPGLRPADVSHAIGGGGGGPACRVRQTAPRPRRSGHDGRCQRRDQAAARDGLPQAPGPARSTQNSPICTTLVGRPGTPVKVHKAGSDAAGKGWRLRLEVPATGKPRPRLAWGAGQAELAAGRSVLTGRHQRHRRRRCRWRAGPDCRGHGRTSSWSGDQRARRLPARPAATPQRPAQR
jgi:hypothetical protein